MVQKAFSDTRQHCLIIPTVLKGFSSLVAAPKKLVSLRFKPLWKLRGKTINPLPYKEKRLQDASGGAHIILPKKGTADAQALALLQGRMPEKCEFPKAMSVAEYWRRSLV